MMIPVRFQDFEDFQELQVFSAMADITIPWVPRGKRGFQYDSRTRKIPNNPRISSPWLLFRHLGFLEENDDSGTFRGFQDFQESQDLFAIADVPTTWVPRGKR